MYTHSFLCLQPLRILMRCRRRVGASVHSPSRCVLDLRYTHRFGRTCTRSSRTGMLIPIPRAALPGGLRFTLRSFYKVEVQWKLRVHSCHRFQELLTSAWQFTLVSGQYYMYVSQVEELHVEISAVVTPTISISLHSSATTVMSTTFTLRPQLRRAQILILWVRALHARPLIALHHSLIALA
jgi:hypothetical protein